MGVTSLGRISTSYAAVLAAASPHIISSPDEGLLPRSTVYPLGTQMYNDDSDLASSTPRTSLPTSRSQVDIHMGGMTNNKGNVPCKPLLRAEETSPVGLCPEYLETTSFSETDGLLLPSVWSEKDRMATIEILGDGSEVKFIGPSKGTEQDAASVRSDHPMPKQCGIFYYEIEILSRGKDGYIGLGFCKANVPLNKLPGWEADSWGYHGDDGHSFCCQGTGKPYGPQFTTGDVVGCAVNFRNGTAFYTKNGVDLGTAFRDLKGTLYPAVGLRTAGEHVRVNFGARPFVFDVEHYIRQEKFRTYAAVNSHSLFPASAGNEDALLAETIQGLISSYLAHDGYIESTRAFAEDTRQEKEAFGKTVETDDKGEKEALQRQRKMNGQWN